MFSKTRMRASRRAGRRASRRASWRASKPTSQAVSQQASKPASQQATQLQRPKDVRRTIREGAGEQHRPWVPPSQAELEILT